MRAIGLITLLLWASQVLADSGNIPLDGLYARWQMGQQLTAYHMIPKAQLVQKKQQMTCPDSVATLVGAGVRTPLNISSQGIIDLPTQSPSWSPDSVLELQRPDDQLACRMTLGMVYQVNANQPLSYRDVMALKPIYDASLVDQPWYVRWFAKSFVGVVFYFPQQSATLTLVSPGQAPLVLDAQAGVLKLGLTDDWLTENPQLIFSEMPEQAKPLLK